VVAAVRTAMRGTSTEVRSGAGSRATELGIAMLDGHQAGLLIAQRPVIDQLTKAQRSKATHKRPSSRTSSPARHMITNLAPGRTVLTNTPTSRRMPVAIRWFTR
jgi:hypothetical protein